VAQSAGLHEPEDRLSPELIDRHRAVVSIEEELDAIDWYDQRVSAATNTELKQILAHNRDEEKEHASMVLEWLRRHDAVLDQHLRTYLFTTGSIVGEEATAEAGDGGGGGVAGAGDGSLGIGSLKEARS
jgi:uncharacterized protein